MQCRPVLGNWRTQQPPHVSEETGHPIRALSDSYPEWLGIWRLLWE